MPFPPLKCHSVTFNATLRSQLFIVWSQNVMCCVQLTESSWCYWFWWCVSCCTVRCSEPPPHPNSQVRHLCRFTMLSSFTQTQRQIHPSDRQRSSSRGFCLSFKEMQYFCMLHVYKLILKNHFKQKYQIQLQYYESQRSSKSVITIQ